MSDGTTIKLGCETDTESKIRWYFKSPQRQLPILLYSGYSFNSDMAWKAYVVHTLHRNELTVHNVTSDDSGSYLCHDIERFSESVSFSVTVKGTLISIYFPSIA